MKKNIKYLEGELITTLDKLKKGKIENIRMKEQLKNAEN